jgi:hypothetical protein
MTPKMTPVRAYLLQRGLFSRVAKKLGLDPSYVSRVARGERRHKKISEALDAELNEILAPLRNSKRKSKK